MRNSLMILSLLFSLNSLAIENGYYDSEEDQCALSVHKIGDELYLTYSENDTALMKSWTVETKEVSDTEVKLIKSSLWSDKEIGSLNYNEQNDSWDLEVQEDVKCEGLKLRADITLGPRK